MKKKNFFRMLLLAIMVGIIVFGLVGTTLGKYKTTVNVDGNIKFDAKLAEELILRETTATRQADGSYALTGTTTTNNKYILLPGVNIPKDPYIEIYGKTDIPAYLFVEVVDNIGNEAISYRLNTCWLKIEGVSGKNGGDVYVYAEGGTAKAITGNISYVDILYANQVVVGQELKHSDSPTDILSFYACLGETAMGNSPWEVYKAIYNMP